MAGSEQRVLPVGIAGGIVPRGGPGKPADGWIRRGPDFHAFPVPVYRMWRACAAGPTPEELMAQGRALGLPEPRAPYEQLVGEDLLVVLPDDPGERRTVLGTHRLHLLMPGLGSAGDGTFALGHDPRAPWAYVGLLTYGVLLASNNGQSIWELCVDAAESADLPPQHVADVLTNELPQLVSGGLAALDAG